MKIKEIIDIAGFEKFLDSGKRVGFQDAAPGIVLARHLEAIDPTILEKKYPELAFTGSGITADNTGGYARTLTTLRKRSLGGFKNAEDTDTNKGKISLATEDSTLKVVVREAESDWSEDEIEEAKLANRNLPEEYISAHLELYNRELDEIGYLGGPNPNNGLLNNAAFVSTPSAGLISALTPAQQYDVIAQLITDQRNAVNNTPEYSANVVDMPTRVLNVISRTILNSAASSASVLKSLRDNFPGVEFRGTFRADTVANGGGLPTNSAVVAYANSDQAMKFRVPVPLKFSEIIHGDNGFKFHVASKYRVGGLDLFESTAGRIVTGL